jgi:hypothetical protein
MVRGTAGCWRVPGARESGPRARIALIATVIAMAVGPGCGREVLGVAKPKTLLEWEPKPVHAAQMTAVKATASGVYVGFSDGEVFGHPQRTGPWVEFDAGVCGQSKPSSPVTSFAIMANRLVASFVGTPGAAQIWHSPEDVGCWASAKVEGDIWSLSVSPFYAYELLATTAGQVWVADRGFDCWGYGSRPISLGFDGVATALATGVGDVGDAPRAWLGDAEGNIYYSDDVATVRMMDPTTPDAIATDAIHWHRVPSPGFPRRAVVALVTHPDDPRRIWITFAAIRADSLWVSEDNGRRWQNPHLGDLPVLDGDVPGAAETDASDGGAARQESATTFTAVSPIPGERVAIVAALRPDSKGNLTSTTFWIADGAAEWWKM